ncbi:hypothetical protein P3S68_021698 [Capsicum galapagoense]
MLFKLPQTLHKGISCRQPLIWLASLDLFDVQSWMTLLATNSSTIAEIFLATSLTETWLERLSRFRSTYPS